VIYFEKKITLRIIN